MGNELEEKGELGRVFSLDDLMGMGARSFNGWRTAIVRDLENAKGFLYSKEDCGSYSVSQVYDIRPYFLKDTVNK